MYAIVMASLGWFGISHNLVAVLLTDIRGPTGYNSIHRSFFQRQVVLGSSLPESLDPMTK